MFILLKENLRRLNTKIGVSGFVVRFETRDKEFISVARLTKGSRSESEYCAVLMHQAVGCESAPSHRDKTRNRLI